MWELDHKESWMPKNWCFRTVVWRRLRSVPWMTRRSNHPKGNQSWIFIGRTDAEAETPILQPPDVKNWLIGKDPDAGKDWRWEDKGTTEDEMAEWHHRINGRKFEWTLGVGDGQGGLACCSPWCRKESDTTEWWNWTVTLFIPIGPVTTDDKKSLYFPKCWVTGPRTTHFIVTPALATIMPFLIKPVLPGKTFSKQHFLNS